MKEIPSGGSQTEATDCDVVGDETENYSATSQTLVVENNHINLPEEPEFMANADCESLKKPVNDFYLKPLPEATRCENEKKWQTIELNHSYKHTHQRNVRTKGKAEERARNCKKKQRKEAP
ncbi:hypothetical protein TNCV_4928031 [Trichonephila clavipes]|nr:hypothetical protein TNCV_4928031 [Trichonephila clavipes]